MTDRGYPPGRGGQFHCLGWRHRHLVAPLRVTDEAGPFARPRPYTVDIYSGPGAELRHGDRGYSLSVPSTGQGPAKARAACPGCEETDMAQGLTIRVNELDHAVA